MKYIQLAFHWKRKRRYGIMDLDFKRKVPMPQIVKEEYPIVEKDMEIKKARDGEMYKIFTGDSRKLLLLIGPCSADKE